MVSRKYTQENFNSHLCNDTRHSPLLNCSEAAAPPQSTPLCTSHMAQISRKERKRKLRIGQTRACGQRQLKRHKTLTTWGWFQTFCWQWETAPQREAVLAFWHQYGGPRAHCSVPNRGLATAERENLIKTWIIYLSSFTKRSPSLHLLSCSKTPNSFT